MRRLLVSLGGFLLLSTALSAAPCTPSPTTLCLNDSRFEVEVSWRDSRDRTGVGQAKTITADTGYFWFFSETNIELVIKVLDARSINQKYWVFFGALTSVEFDLTVIDTVTGAERTYHNPLGQFASVGDTGAFDPGVTTPSREIVVTEGQTAAPESLDAVQRFIETDAPAARAFTPCPAAASALLLNDCRFALSVEWADSRGRTGRGAPVQLTNDTGYFWFFSPDNVELMVKVLDARAISGKFWVFFGALSNVNYTITVRDLATTAVKGYVNPSGTFASVGDTAAFRGGYSVTPVREPGRAVSADFDVEGGSISATGQDGTVFTLELPPNALSTAETVTLTPVSRLDRFPFSGGLVGGVEIEPEGLDLVVPATLTIRPASSPPVDRTLPYSYGRGGEDLILYLRDVDTSSLRLPLVRFAGYGAGQGDPTEAARQAEKVPTGPLAPFLQQYAYEVFLRVRGVITQAELVERATQLYRDAVDELIASVLPLTGGSAPESGFLHKEERCHLEDPEWMAGYVTLVAVIRQRQLLPDPETTAADTLIDGFVEMLQVCIEEAFARCLARNDPYEALLMLHLTRQLVLMGEQDPRFAEFAEGSFIGRCLRFQLDFESKVVLESTSPGAALTTRMKYRSPHVPLSFEPRGNPYAKDEPVWDGDCTLLPVDVSLDIPDATSDCRVIVDHAGSDKFTAAAAWIGIQEDPTRSAVKLLYDPGNPVVKATLKCDGEPDTDVPIFQFGVEYDLLHKDDAHSDAPFMADRWDQLRLGPGPSHNGEFFAKKSYERTIPFGNFGTLTEETWFILKHTPDALMPVCP